MLTRTLTSVCSQWGAVGRQIVGDVLPEERPAGLDFGVPVGIVSVAESARRADLVQRPFVLDERRELEHAPISPLRIERRIDAMRGEAVVAQVNRRAAPVAGCRAVLGDLVSHGVAGGPKA
jgi:hypothetical protein